MANELMGSAIVEVGGQRYDNFTALQVTRDKNNLTASGTITLSWPGAEMFNAQSAPAQEMVDGAKGTMYLDGQKVATFRIDSRTSSGNKDSFKLDLAFRGLTASLVDSQADHPSGQENKKKAPEIVKKLMEGYEPQLKDKSGGGGKQQERFVIQEGESVERAIRRAAREFGLLARENEDGDLILEKKGADEGSGQALVLGKNFIQWSVKRDISPRHSKIKVKGASIPTDEKYGKKAEELVGDAVDDYVKFKRELHIFAESDQDKETLKKRAKQEMNRRKAQGLNVSLTMSTWSDDGGQLWKVGKMHHVTIPVDQVDDDLQVSAVSFTLTKDQREATLTLVDKEAYDDEEGGGDSGKAKAGKSGGGGDGAKGEPLFN
jgi:prophage tail gpP-like protein